MAGLALHAKIRKIGGLASRFPDVVHVDCPIDIPDRTAFLSSGSSSTPNPGKILAEQVLALNLCERDQTKTTRYTTTVGVACNTFHVPRIFDEFIGNLQTETTKFHVVDMLEATRDALCKLRQQCPNGNLQVIGLLSTAGTRESRVFRDLLEPRFNVYEVSAEAQKLVDKLIYDTSQGIKQQSNPCTQWAQQTCVRLISELAAAGAQAVILGCSELPLALVGVSLPAGYRLLEDPLTFQISAGGQQEFMIIDPVACLARRLVGL